MAETISRRNFLAGTGIAAATIAGMTALSGCSSRVQESASDVDSGAVPESLSSKVTDTIDCDVVIVGSGVAGLAAGVRSIDHGLNTVILEVSGERGGYGPEGICAVNSSLSKDAGIELSDADIAEIVEQDDQYFNFRLNTLFWHDFLDASGELIDWLITKGVEFTGKIDNYGIGHFPTFHWFPGDHDCANAYSAHMEESFLGSDLARLMTNTRGQELIQDESGAITGIYAVSSIEDKVYQINAKAVVLATGGYGANNEMVAQYHDGMPVGRWICSGNPTNVGDGIAMASSVGANIVASHRCFLGHVVILGKDEAIYNAGEATTGCWVNEAGERYTNEACSLIAKLSVLNPVREQKDTYVIYDMDSLTAAGDTFVDLFTAAADDGSNAVFKADTIEELAEKAGLDAATLSATINRYNEMCDAGFDSDFKKPKECLIKIATPPFFCGHQTLRGNCSIGGIDVNRKYQVITKDKTPIEGLYAAGIDCTQLYRETYKIEVPGSCMGSNIYSGVTAIDTIAESLGK